MNIALENSLVLLIAVILDWLLGDPAWLPHPVAGIGRLIARLEPLMRRWFGDSRLAGVMLLISTTAVTISIAGGVLFLAYRIHHQLGLLVAIIISWSCLAARSLHLESRLAADRMEAGDLSGGRQYLSRIVGRDTAELDEAGVWRGVVETVAENSSDGVIAPLFWLMLGGPLLALAYKTVNTLDSMVGYRNERYLKVGWASARCDDIANLLPARLTGLLMVLTAPVVGLSGSNAFCTMLRDGRRHASPNSGIPEAAAAGALRVQLGGASSYGGVMMEKPAIGLPEKELSATAYRGVIRLMYASELLLLLIWALIFRCTL
jgi:adenosylcobinamide-phosphate synthase